MANTYRVLGQSAPSATTNTDAYTVPSGYSSVLSTIVVCNRAATAGTYRLAVRPAGATLANEHYIAYDTPIAGNDSTTLTIGITLGELDVITAYCSTANMSISVFGTEMS